MAFLLPNLSAPPLLSPYPNPSPNPHSKPFLFSYSSSSSSSSSSSLLVRDALQEKPPKLREKPPTPHRSEESDRIEKRKEEKDEFYLNLGVAVRTLRDDLPALFVKDLNYVIYRDDITFVDPLNTFKGIENYKLIFWALRFHGRILFREIGLKIFRIWQPSENMILIRWELHGVPRVPWEAEGRFEGTSRYKLDRNGKIYEHRVDNLALNFPRVAMGPKTVLDLVMCPPSPNLTFGNGSCSWVELYRAVRGTLEEEEKEATIEGLVTCS
ncbi:uncharacterized protein LOC109720681 [Ananas comosus]|uniref:Uncharacterized protein LOC109720681 n=1 Tax=Ananas comosus TaxID=4615 RepID=A0A6P5G5F0_ANACO|nr:uncharacterized protein LOC109720681 [Ananas comosus]